jgi:hypothetical protein
LQTVGEAKLKAALRASGEDVNQERLDFLIQLAVNQDRFLSEAEQSKKVGGHCLSRIMIVVIIRILLHPNSKDIDLEG